MKDPTKLDIGVLKHHIQEAVECIKISEEYKNSEAIILLGASGVGKSTVSMLFHGCKLYSADECNTGTYIIQKNADQTQEVKEYLKGKKFEHNISPTAKAETIYPIRLKDKYKNFYFWDTPGFGDNRGITQDLCNSLYIKRLFDTHKDVKILIVTSHSSITDNRMKLFASVIKSSQRCKSTR